MNRLDCVYVEDKACFADDIRTGELPDDACTLCAQLSIAQALEKIAEALDKLI